METKLYALMLLVFISYVSFIIMRYGVQRSISDSFYRLPKKVNWLFVAFCWGFAFPAMIIGTLQTQNGLMFFAASGIMFVGAAAAFKQKLTKTVHFTGAYGGVALSQISIVYDYKMWYVTVAFVVLALILELLKVKNKIWWQEILAFVSICVVLVVNL